MTVHKQRLLDYFNGRGFERWQQIYGDAPIAGVRRTIRIGHQQMLDLALAWLAEATRPSDLVLDAGCGTGLLTLGMAQRGRRVQAVDLAPQMANATEQALQSAGMARLVNVQVGDLEQIVGQYAAVACLDVLIHYPAELFAGMLSHLAARSQGGLIFTYAPYEPLLAALHWLGGRFPQAQRRTDIQMIADREVAQVLAASGYQISRKARISRGFYHVTLVQADRRIG
ncbi:MAG: magnesium protoporphyrin IX methyltransferase [Roseiflexaceae bacterium]